MSTIDLSDAHARLPEIIAALSPGQRVVIVDSGKPVATMTRSDPKRWPCKAGSAKHIEHSMSPDLMHVLTISRHTLGERISTSILPLCQTSRPPSTTGSTNRSS